LLSAVVWALQIIGLSAWSRPQDVYASSFVQMVACAALCSVAAVPGGIALPSGGGQWAGTLYLAVVAGTLAIIGQTWAQAHLPATRAAIIMTMEPVWASVFAVALGGESVSGRLLIGGPLVLGAMALAEAPVARARQRSRRRPSTASARTASEAAATGTSS
jgi:drug/metabolite transporter (DMT)-like permease